MLGSFYLVVDTFCEASNTLIPFADQTFWDINLVEIQPNSVVVLSRQTLENNAQLIKNSMDQKLWLPVLVNPTEGSQTMLYQCDRLGLLPYIKKSHMLLIGCGDMEPEIPCLWYDSYLYKPYDYTENLQQCNLAKAIFTKLNKPYQFLFLNGRTRAHRKYLIERLKDNDLLSNSLWTNLDITPVSPHTNIYGEICNRPSELRLLPLKYEVERYRTGITEQYQYRFVKDELFDNTWGEIYLQAEPYIDTYFSVVSETVFDYPYSLRSEKIYKPIAIGHPFIAAANCGFYRDLHRAGFKTFGHLIDESFDNIDNGQERLEKIVSVIKDLCSQNLNSFILAAKEVCEYNQLHMVEQAPKIKKEFIPQFQKFLEQHIGW